MRVRRIKVADGLKRLREQRLNLQFPQMCKDYDEYARLRDYQRSYETEHSRLLERLATDAINEELKADHIIRELFAAAKTIPIDASLVSRARLRYDLGNPPGKNGSLGDAINWEALLTAVPAGGQLYFISDDKDYCSALDEQGFDPYLLEEWTAAKSTSIVFHKRLSSLFNERFPHIRLATELEKDLLIRDLANSRTFAETHRLVAKLQRFTDFTGAQLNDLLNAATGNSQVYWIIHDGDVKDFLSGAISGKEDKITPALLQELRTLMEEDVPVGDDTDDDDLPF